MTEVGEMMRSLIFIVTTRGSIGGQVSVNSEEGTHRRKNFMHSCSRQVWKCLNFHIFFALFVSCLFIVEVMKNLSVDDVE
jgi:hypothetical protein